MDPVLNVTESRVTGLKLTWATVATVPPSKEVDHRQ